MDVPTGYWNHGIWNFGIFSKNAESGSFLEVLEVNLAPFEQNKSTNEVFMITRKSFFIRWLLVREEKGHKEERSVIDVQHIQSGDSQRVSSLEEASLWMSEVDADKTEASREEGLN